MNALQEHNAALGLFYMTLTDAEDLLDALPADSLLARRIVAWHERRVEYETRVEEQNRRREADRRSLLLSGRRR